MNSSCDRFTEREAMSSENWRAHLAECQDCLRQQSVDRVLRVSLAGFSEPRPSLDLQSRVVAEAARRHHERLLGSPWQRHLMRAYWAIAMAVSYLIVTGLPLPVAFDASGWVRLDCDEPPLAVYASVRLGNSTLRGFATSMLGVDEGNLNNESLRSSLREVLNVIGGRIKFCCAASQVDLRLGPAQTADDLPEAAANPQYQWTKLFGWDSGEVFEVSVAAGWELGS